MTVDPTTRQLLRRYAELYETVAFLEGDPSWFMHQVEGDSNREATAFVASCLSYGRRDLFLPRIGQLLDWAGGDMDRWIRGGHFTSHLPPGDTTCFYRLQSRDTMHRFLSAYQQLMESHGSLGNFVQTQATTAIEAIGAICAHFAASGSVGVVPRNAQSACKRLCMFMRWMVRDGSPVDLGLWAHFIDRRTLIMPLDVHVLNQACQLRLVASNSATMSAAQRLTETMATVFPDDPLKGDYALFGYDMALHDKNTKNEL